MLSSSEVLSAILERPTNLDHVRSLVTDDVTYVSLNYDNTDLRSIMPWCGWDIIAFEPEAVFGSGEYAAMFGRFTYRSTVLSKLATSPFAIFAEVRDGRCYYLQFMEDTLATSASFRSGGQWTFRSNPEGGEVAV